MGVQHFHGRIKRNISFLIFPHRRPYRANYAAVSSFLRLDTVPLSLLVSHAFGSGAPSLPVPSEMALAGTYLDAGYAYCIHLRVRRSRCRRRLGRIRGGGGEGNSDRRWYEKAPNFCGQFFKVKVIVLWTLDEGLVIWLSQKGVASFFL